MRALRMRSLGVALVLTAGVVTASATSASAMSYVSCTDQNALAVYRWSSPTNVYLYRCYDYAGQDTYSGVNEFGDLYVGDLGGHVWYGSTNQYFDAETIDEYGVYSDNYNLASIKLY